MSLYCTLDRPVLLLSGTRSPALLREAVTRLRTVLPEADHFELEGLSHDGPWNGGNPLLVAEAINNFLGSVH